MPAEYLDYNICHETRVQMHKSTDLRCALLTQEVEKVIHQFLCTKRQSQLCKQLGLDLFDYLVEEMRLLGHITVEHLLEFCGRRIGDQTDLDQATQLL